MDSCPYEQTCRKDGFGFVCEEPSTRPSGSGDGPFGSGDGMFDRNSAEVRKPKYWR